MKYLLLIYEGERPTPMTEAQWNEEYGVYMALDAEAKQRGIACIAAAGDVTLDGISVGPAAGDSTPTVIAGSDFTAGAVPSLGGSRAA